MKKFMESVLEWKKYAALMFSGTIILCIVFSIYTGAESIPISMIIYLLILSVIGTFLQFLAFTDRIIKNMRLMQARRKKVLRKESFGNYNASSL